MNVRIIEQKAAAVFRTRKRLSAVMGAPLRLAKCTVKLPMTFAGRV